MPMLPVVLLAAGLVAALASCVMLAAAPASVPSITKFLRSICPPFFSIMHETLQMDQYFEYFLEKMGPAIERRHVPPSSIEHYRGKLPDQLLAYWEEHGWCGYADGLFWTVDPQEFEPVLGAVLGNTAFAKQDTYYLIARGAFGELYFWGEKTGHSLSVIHWREDEFWRPSIFRRNLSQGERL
jgi:hypothetical protein